MAYIDNVQAEQAITDNEDAFYTEKPIHEAMEEVCICGHRRVEHYDCSDDCDNCKCLGFKIIPEQGRSWYFIGRADTSIEQWTADVKELKADAEKWEQSRRGHEQDSNLSSNSSDKELPVVSSVEERTICPSHID